MTKGRLTGVGRSGRPGTSDIESGPEDQGK